MYEVEETEDGPEVHGHIGEGDRMLIFLLVIGLPPAGLVYWAYCARKADNEAWQDWYRDQVRKSAVHLSKLDQA
jgi:hypothetical protein